MRIKLTPKTVATAIGVSESSMKRWCDRGFIEFNTTTGGHRRISQASMVQFLRKTDYSLLKPELLGLPPGTTRTNRSLEQTRSDFLSAVLEGNQQLSQRLVLEHFLSGVSIADLGDRVIAPAFHQIGDLWQGEDLEVYRERRACEISMRVLMKVRELIPQSAQDAPLAIGAAPESDSYVIPSTLVEMVLQESGWRAQSLGAQLPFETLSQAAQAQMPRLFWLSVTSIGKEQEFLARCDQFRQSLHPNTFFVVGGQALNPSVRQKMKFSMFADNLQQLQTLATNIRATTVGKSVANSTATPTRVTNY